MARKDAGVMVDAARSAGKPLMVIPALADEPPKARLMSPRLVHLEQAKDFQKAIIHDASV